MSSIAQAARVLVSGRATRLSSMLDLDTASRGHAMLFILPGCSPSNDSGQNESNWAAESSVAYFDHWAELHCTLFHVN